MSKIKNCLVCGKEYEYCTHCRDAQLQPWKALYDTENCQTLKYVWDEHRNGIITDADFKKKADELGFKPADITNKLIKETLEKCSGTKKTVKAKEVKVDEAKETTPSKKEDK